MTTEQERQQAELGGLRLLVGALVAQMSAFRPGFAVELDERLAMQEVQARNPAVRKGLVFAREVIRTTAELRPDRVKGATDAA